MLINERPEEDRHPEFDNEASLKEADSRLGLKRVIEEYGLAPQSGNWKSFHCPFCKKKSKSAQVFEASGGVTMFKCYSTSCPTGAKAMPAVQFIAHQAGLSNKDAFVAYLKMAGVWKDRTKLKGETSLPTPTGQGAPESGNGAPKVAGDGCDAGPGPEATSLQDSGVVDAAANDAGGSVPGTPAIPPPATAPAPVPVTAPPDPPHEPDGWRSLREFFSRLNLSDLDGESLYGKRGIFYSTSAALRYRSNPKTNRDILIELEKKYGAEEVLASGLWLPEDRARKKPRRPNSQFCGLGVTNKKADDKPDDENAEKFSWAWIHPVLIPYFDEAGELMTLRPHKGMGRSGTLVGTPHIYVPRGLGGALDGAPEVFFTVVITEGEFKAGAIWQVLGCGRSDGREPIGVVALPGITFGKNYDTREVLDDWLARVKCREVIVVFDNEDKSDPALESFKSDHRRRFDSEIWARYLATDLSKKLHIRGKVGILPASWRNSKGKADWDGAAAEIVRGKKLTSVEPPKKRERGVKR